MMNANSHIFTYFIMDKGAINNNIALIFHVGGKVTVYNVYQDSDISFN